MTVLEQVEIRSSGMIRQDCEVYQTFACHIRALNPQGDGKNSIGSSVVGGVFSKKFGVGLDSISS
ncbi:hypothetical protein [Vibrio harveyi]|uniref:hypothetical protein n=1 Tax=Vibrio harveyi TaxID=669 RepID=UPI000648E560|nr:hypothetical protein [Vibrio harveyi]